MGIERVSHYIDNVLTEAQARMGLRDTRLLVTWYTNRENKRSVVHSHPYHELVLPIGRQHGTLLGGRQRVSGPCGGTGLLSLSGLPLRQLQH